MPQPDILNRTSADRLAFEDKLKAGPMGAGLTYDELEKVVGRSCRPDGPAYPALARARKSVERDFGLVWQPIASHEGLKCLTPDDMAKLPADKLARLARAARRAARQLNNIAARHAGAMTEQERVRFCMHQSAINAVASVLHSRRQTKLEGPVTAAMKPLPPAKTLEVLMGS